jgi:hypothetical protein
MSKPEGSEMAADAADGDAGRPIVEQAATSGNIKISNRTLIAPPSWIARVAGE